MAPFCVFCANAGAGQNKEHENSTARNTVFEIFIATLPMREDILNEETVLLKKLLYALRLTNPKTDGKDVTWQYQVQMHASPMKSAFRT